MPNLGNIIEGTFVVIIIALVLTNAGGFNKVASGLTSLYTSAVGALLEPAGMAM